MLTIDRLIHEVHETTDMLWTSPAASNLIQGKEWQIAELLDELAYGDDIPEARKEDQRRILQKNEKVRRDDENANCKEERRSE